MVIMQPAIQRRIPFARLRAMAASGLCLGLAVLAACSSFPPASFPGGPGSGPGNGTGNGQPGAPRSGAPGAVQPQPAPRPQSGPSPQSLEAAARRAAASQQASLQLQAARAWLLSGKPGEAARVLGALPAQLTPQQAIDKRVLQAELTLSSGHAQQAWQEITAVPAPAGTASEAPYYESRMHIALAAARPVEGVRAELSAERLTTDAAQLARLRESLLLGLREARERGVKLEAEASQDPTIRGWLELGSLASGGASVASSATAARWRAQYPEHPATRLLPEALPEEMPVAARLRRVALVLPMTGPASGYAAIVRSGLEYARQQLPEGSRPELALYDTGAVSVPEALRQARAEGADFIVGPLTRPEVDAAVAASPGVTTLALNYPSSGRAPSGMVLFALSPEDEARAVARRILASGARHGATFVPAGEWGTRVLAAFAQELQSGGGEIVSQGTYDATGHDFTGPIRAVLGTDRSYARRQRLEAVTGGRFEFEPRARADLEFLFVPGQSSSLRLLRPQLRFQYGGSVPVFATSDAYSVDGGVANQDLEGLILPTMPWLVPASTSSSVHDAVQAQAAPDDTAWQSGLFAFGYDACQRALAVAAAGPARTELRVAGLTGQLAIDSEGRVHREPLWARVTRTGLPQVLPVGATQLAAPVPASE
jgi:outer membrane PBP1 activator LpoA protein